MTHEHYMDLLDKLQEWYQKGYIFPESFVVTTSQIQDLISANRVGGANFWYSSRGG